MEKINYAFSFNCIHCLITLIKEYQDMINKKNLLFQSKGGSTGLGLGYVTLTLASIYLYKCT